MPGAERRRRTSVSQRIRIGSFEASNASPVFFIAGPCVLESEGLLERVAGGLKRVFRECRAPWILKCSFDKANRSALSGFRGPGLARSLEVFARVKRDLGVPLLTDIHDPRQAPLAARVADVLQIPAFLCRQTDLLVAAGRTGRAVNIKKGQFMSPWDMENTVEKVASTGNRRILLTERGASFGYGNLVVDMRSLAMMARTGCPVVFDSTHSCQLPGSQGDSTGGQREFAAPLARAAAAVGVAGVFFETHPDPGKAKSDGGNTLPLKVVKSFVRSVIEIDRLVKKRPRAPLRAGRDRGRHTPRRRG